MIPAAVGPRKVMTQESQLDALPGTCCSDRLFTGRLSWKGKMRLLSFVGTVGYQVPPGVYHEVDWSLDSPTSKYVYIYIYTQIFPYCVRVQVFSSSLSTTHIVSDRSFIFCQWFGGWSFWRQKLSITTIRQSHTLWLCQNSYWKWWFIVDFPIENGDFL